MKDKVVIEHAKRYFKLYLEQLKTLPYKTARYNYLFEMSKLYQNNALFKRGPNKGNEEI